MKKRIDFLFFIMALLPFTVSSVSGQNFDGLKNINGTEIYCRTAGEGEPLMIVHGGPGLAHNYLYEPFSNLTDNFKLIFYDQRGCGKSAGIMQGDSLTTDMLVEDLEELRKEFGIDKMNLAGQSWGAILALNYVIRYPENVKKLILLEPGPASTEYFKPFQENILKRLSQADIQRITALSQMQQLKTDPELFEEFLGIRFKAYHYSPDISSRINFDYMDSSYVSKFFDTSAMLGKYLADFNIYDDLNKINCPVLIIHGDYDPIPVESVERMKENIKTAELRIIKNTGHFVHLENPDIYFGLIREFLDRK